MNSDETCELRAAEFQLLCATFHRLHINTVWYDRDQRADFFGGLSPRGIKAFLAAGASSGLTSLESSKLILVCATPHKSDTAFRLLTVRYGQATMANLANDSPWWLIPFILFRPEERAVVLHPVRCSGTLSY